MSNLDTTIDKLKADVTEAVQQAYIDGFNAGSAADKPTQAEFDAAHKEPKGYGEDGEVYVMAADLTEAQALHALKTLFDKEMYDYDGVGDLQDHLQSTKIAYAPEDISTEPGYYYRADGSGAYNAWVWTA